MKKEKLPDQDAIGFEKEETDLWLTSPELVKNFVETRPDYQQLCDEVQYILAKRLKERSIQVSSVTARAKTLTSYLEKIQRKEYVDPLQEITDLAGARIVCLYPKDRAAIEEIINKEFNVIERIDKSSEKKVDQFGYLAVHFVVTLGRAASGARYDDLKHLRCEIQVRTVLQDAWAIIQHHLIYKHENDVPKEVQRKLNSLAGLLEAADDLFESARDERDRYVNGMKAEKTNKVAFLHNEINLDSTTEYLTWKFPDKPLQKFHGQLSKILEYIKLDKYKTLNDLDQAINATAEKRQKLVSFLSDTHSYMDGKIPAAVELAWALSILDKQYFARPTNPPSWKQAIKSLEKIEKLEGKSKVNPETKGK
jgi:ppGpp synthetase/RelA/SpoT-type nucleotidyltranferase